MLMHPYSAGRKLRRQIARFCLHRLPIGDLATTATRAAEKNYYLSDIFNVMYIIRNLKYLIPYIFAHTLTHFLYVVSDRIVSDDVSPSPLGCTRTRLSLEALVTASVIKVQKLLYVALGQPFFTNRQQCHRRILKSTDSDDMPN